MALTIFLADDEEGMRLMLRKAIEKTEGCTCIGESSDGESAWRLASELRPDVVFLDVEMPVMNGISCAEKIQSIAPMTRIIFATAHESYMPDAFRLYAYDYLVKPFNPLRVKESLERIMREKTQIRDGEAGATGPSIPVRLHASEIRRLMIRGREGIRFIDEKNIRMIAREDRSTILHTTEGRISTSDSLTELMERLDPNLFMRCHKSFIINLSVIREITPYGRWTWNVSLNGCTESALMTHDNVELLGDLFS